MKVDSGWLVWPWGPLVLVAALVVVFRFAEPGGGGAASPATPDASAPGADVVPPPSVRPSGAGATAPPPPAASGAGGEVRGFAGPSGPSPWYPAESPPYPGGPGRPPWAAYRWAEPFPRPGDHSGRYWGGGAAEWGPPIGEYGPDTQVDPYWWAPAEETDRR